VLWDVDFTLVDAGGIGWHLYELAFTEMFGEPPPRPSSLAGRTDRAIALEVLALAGQPDPRQQVAAFEAVMAARAPELAGLVRERGVALPGAAAAMAALADGHRPQAVVQSLLTGNIRPLAEVKLGPLGLTRHLDLDVGAYGDASAVRAELVDVARRGAALTYRRSFAGEATVLVGDTPLDVGAALASGARGVGVATGLFSAGELAAAGAHAVLPDLTDTGRVLAAILGLPRP